MIMQPDFVGADTVQAAIARVHAFIQARSSLRGKHHEIYLSDIRRAAPSRWKTIIRQPMNGWPTTIVPANRRRGSLHSS